MNYRLLWSVVLVLAGSCIVSGMNLAVAGTIVTEDIVGYGEGLNPMEAQSNAEADWQAKVVAAANGYLAQGWASVDIIYSSSVNSGGEENGIHWYERDGFVVFDLTAPGGGGGGGGGGPPPPPGGGTLYFAQQYWGYGMGDTYADAEDAAWDQIDEAIQDTKDFYMLCGYTSVTIESTFTLKHYYTCGGMKCVDIEHWANFKAE